MSKSIIYKYPRLTIFLVNVVLLIFICAVGEMVLRLWTPEWLTYRMQYLNVEEAEQGVFGSDKSWKVVRKDGEFVAFEANSSVNISHNEYAYKAMIDQYGGRMVSGSEGKKDSVKLPFLGDSFVFGVGVKDGDDFVSLLQARSSYRLLNLGVPGSSLPNQLFIIASRFEELDNPLVAFFGFFLGNDFQDIINDNKKNDKQVQSVRESGTSKKAAKKNVATKSVAEQVNAYVFHHDILKRSYLIQYLRKVMVSFYNSFRNEQKALNPVFRIMNKNEKKYISKVKSLLDREVSKLSEIAREKDFTPVCILIPSKYQLSKKVRKLQAEAYGIDFSQLDENQPNRILTTLLTKYGIPYIDPFQCLMKYDASDKLYFIQDNHLTAEGHRQLFRCIQEQVMAYIIIGDSLTAY